MELNEQKNRLLILTSILLMIIVLAGGFYYAYRALFSEPVKKKKKKEEPVVEEKNYNIRLIKEINKNENGNYLISPYSIEIALSMLRDGSAGNTKKELDNLLGDRKINILNADKKINVANGTFIREGYKDKILSSYYDTVKSKYNSEVIYDKFESPDVVNNWVKKETYDMIPELLDELNPEDEIVLVNALAIDVEWKNVFECDYTSSAEFNKEDGSKIDVAMMHETFKSDTKFFEMDNAKGIILPYKEYDENNNNLEFIGILPDGDIKDYVNNLSKDTIDNIDKKAWEASHDENIYVAIPSFKYDYSVKDLVSVLDNLGVKDVFNKEKADLSKLSSEKLYVSKVVHKTNISLKEKGTKAAASTAVIGTSITAAPTKTEKIEFNKPFIYIIRDQKTKEMLFFGVVYEPNKWEGSTCEK